MLIPAFSVFKSRGADCTLTGTNGENLMTNTDNRVKTNNLNTTRGDLPRPVLLRAASPGPVCTGLGLWWPRFECMSRDVLTLL